jgi:hypothetical protein
MRRETFEEMLRQALDGLAANPAENAAEKQKHGETGIGGISYGDAERRVAQAVSRLSAPGRPNKPLIVPSSEMVPPCF